MLHMDQKRFGLVFNFMQSYQDSEVLFYEH